MPSWSIRFDLTVDLQRSDLVALVERAHALASVIRDIPIPPHLQLELDTINIMRAVRGTTAMEGAQVSTSEVRQIMESAERPTLPEARSRDEQEVRNAQEVMYYVAHLLEITPDHPVTQELICKLHELTTKDIDYKKNVPGQYRSHNVNAGDYLPPDGSEVRDLMSHFVEWFNSAPAINWDPIVRALAAHFYLISIHPFGDGNGRTSRALESFLLYQGKANARGFYSLANYYYQHRSDYVWHLDDTRFNTRNDLTPFVLFGLQGLVDELQGVHAQVINEVKLISFRDYARERFLHEGLLGTKAGERLFHFLLALGREPTSISDLRTKTGAAALYRRVTLRTFQRDLAFLKDQELVKMDNKTIAPNLELMEQFTALKALREAHGF